MYHCTLLLCDGMKSSIVKRVSVPEESWNHSSACSWNHSSAWVMKPFLCMGHETIPLHGSWNHSSAWVMKPFLCMGHETIPLHGSWNHSSAWVMKPFLCMGHETIPLHGSWNHSSAWVMKPFLCMGHETIPLHGSWNQVIYFGSIINLIIHNILCILKRINSTMNINMHNWSFAIESKHDFIIIILLLINSNLQNL